LPFWKVPLFHHNPPAHFWGVKEREINAQQPGSRSMKNPYSFSRKKSWYTLQIYYSEKNIPSTKELRNMIYRSKNTSNQQSDRLIASRIFRRNISLSLQPKPSSSIVCQLGHFGINIRFSLSILHVDITTRTTAK